MSDDTTLPLPLLNVGFVCLTLLAVYAFYRLSGRRGSILLGLLVWMGVCGVLVALGVVRDSYALPPRMGLLMLPMLVVGLLLGFSRMGRSIRAGTSVEGLQYFQAIRVIVEVVFLPSLYYAGYLARVVTFEGYNFDLLPGLLGPVVGYLVFRRRTLGVGWAVAYQWFGVLILLSVVGLAVLSAPSGYQQFGQQQATVAIFYLPFVWLPTVVVPLMLWAHFISLGKLRGADAGAVEAG
jgi:hypothetical protein